MKYCEETDTDFFTIDLSRLKTFSDVFEDDISEIINPEKSTERKLYPGSSSKTEILKQISDLKNCFNEKFFLPHVKIYKKNSTHLFLTLQINNFIYFPFLLVMNPGNF